MTTPAKTATSRTASKRATTRAPAKATTAKTPVRRTAAAAAAKAPAVTAEQHEALTAAVSGLRQSLDEHAAQLSELQQALAASRLEVDRLKQDAALRATTPSPNGGDDDDKATKSKKNKKGKKSKKGKKG